MEPRSQAAVDEIMALLPLTGLNVYFLGGTDVAVEGQWIWNSDGSQIARDGLWDAGEPSAPFTHYDALCIRADNGKFRDCNYNVNLFPFFCETPE